MTNRWLRTVLIFVLCGVPASACFAADLELEIKLPKYSLMPGRIYVLTELLSNYSSEKKTMQRFRILSPYVREAPFEFLHSGPPLQPFKYHPYQSIESQTRIEISKNAPPGPHQIIVRFESVDYPRSPSMYGDEARTISLPLTVQIAPKDLPLSELAMRLDDPEIRAETVMELERFGDQAIPYLEPLLADRLVNRIVLKQLSNMNTSASINVLKAEALSISPRLEKELLGPDTGALDIALSDAEERFPYTAPLSKTVSTLLSRRDLPPKRADFVKERAAYFISKSYQITPSDDALNLILEVIDDIVAGKMAGNAVVNYTTMKSATYELIAGLPRLSREQVISKCLNGTDPSLVIVCLDVLEKNPDPAFVSVLRELLHRKEFEISQRAAADLGALRADAHAAVGELTAIYLDRWEDFIPFEDHSTYSPYLFALARIGSTEANKIVAAHVLELRRRIEAQTVLARKVPSGLEPTPHGVFRVRFNDEAPNREKIRVGSERIDFRSQYIADLSWLKEFAASAIPTIAGLLDDSALDVHKSAVAALLAFHTPDAERFLRQYAGGEIEKFRKDPCAAGPNIVVLGSYADSMLPRLVGTFSEKPEKCRCVKETLVQLGTAEALNALQSVSCSSPVISSRA